MSDDEFDGVAGGLYMMELIDSAPETVSLIHSIWDGFIFQSFVSFCPEKATPINLSKEEVKKMLIQTLSNGMNFIHNYSNAFSTTVLETNPMQLLYPKHILTRNSSINMP